jgi:hypothetical protein
MGYLPSNTISKYLIMSKDLHSSAYRSLKNTCLGYLPGMILSNLNSPIQAMLDSHFAD